MQVIGNYQQKIGLQNNNLQNNSPSFKMYLKFRDDKTRDLFYKAWQNVYDTCEKKSESFPGGGFKPASRFNDLVKCFEELTQKARGCVIIDVDKRKILGKDVDCFSLVYRDKQRFSYKIHERGMGGNAVSDRIDVSSLLPNNTLDGGTKNQNAVKFIMSNILNMDYINKSWEYRKILKLKKELDI